MPNRFDQDFAKGFTSTFGNAFSDSSSNWLRMQQLRQEIENNNFTRDQYLQKRRAEEYDRRKAIGKQKKMLEDKKRYLLSNFAERPLPTSGDPVQNVANLDIQEEMLRKRIAEAEDDDELSFIVPEVEKRFKTKAERQKIERDTAILKKQLEINDEMPSREKQKVEVFLDGTPEGLDAAKRQFTSWKPDKVDKKSLAEEKADLREEIDSLGDGDFNAGFEQLKQVDPQKYSRANALGIKRVKSEDEVNTEKLYDLVIKEINGRTEDEKGKDISDYTKEWMENRESYLRSVYGAKAVDTVKSRILKDVIFGAGTTDEQIQSSMMKTAPQPAPTPTAPTMQPPVAPMQAPAQEPIAPDTTQQPQTPADPDEQRAVEIMAKPAEEITPEEEAFLQSYLAKVEGAAQ